MTKNAERKTKNADSFEIPQAMLRQARSCYTAGDHREALGHFHMIIEPSVSGTAKHRGFTLIELLVVIAILGLIASLVGPSVMRQFGGAKVDTARLQIADLSAALDLYYLDIGRYPSTAEGLASLVSAPEAAREWNGPYLKKTAVPSDPWGNAYVYRAPGENGPYDLVSYGADGQIGGERDGADIASWE